MKKANEYTNWKGGFTYRQVKSLELPPGTVVWVKSMCEEGLESPGDCIHNPVRLEEYLEDYEGSFENAFYSTENKKRNLADLLNNRTAIISLITAIFALILGIMQCADKITADQPKSDSLCDCDYQDVNVKYNKRNYKFRVVYLTREKKWKFESTEYLETNEKIAEVLPPFLKKIPDFQKVIGVISVGLASQEGDNLKVEEARAVDRADKIADILRTTNYAKELYTLSLGKYLLNENVDKNLTGYQRRVIVIGIMEKEEGLKKGEIERALRLALKDIEGLNFSTERYSKFTFDKVK